MGQRNVGVLGPSPERSGLPAVHLPHKCSLSFTEQTQIGTGQRGPREGATCSVPSSKALVSSYNTPSAGKVTMPIFPLSRIIDELT